MFDLGDIFIDEEGLDLRRPTSIYLRYGRPPTRAMATALMAARIGELLCLSENLGSAGGKALRWFTKTGFPRLLTVFLLIST